MTTTKRSAPRGRIQVGVIEVVDDTGVQMHTMRAPTPERILHVAKETIGEGGRIDIYCGQVALTIHKQQSSREYWIEICAQGAPHREGALVSLQQLRPIVRRFLSGRRVTLARTRNVISKSRATHPDCSRATFEMRRLYGLTSRRSP